MTKKIIGGHFLAMSWNRLIVKELPRQGYMGTSIHRPNYRPFVNEFHSDFCVIILSLCSCGYISTDDDITVEKST